LASVELRGLTKRYGSHAAVDDVSLTIEHGRLVCLLDHPAAARPRRFASSPASSSLRRGNPRRRADRVFAGAHAAARAAQHVDDFQSYALWPHMTVGENVAYGLKLRKNDRDTIARKLKSILTTTHLDALGIAIRASCREAAAARGARARPGGRAGDPAAR